MTTSKLVGDVTAGQSTNMHFYQWRSSITGERYHKEPSVAPTGTHSYKLDCVNNVWSIYINGAKQAATVDHSTRLKWDRTNAQLLGEVRDNPDDQSPGTNADPITMGYLKIKNSSGTWSTVSVDWEPSGSQTLPHQRNNCDVGDSTFEQWDSRY